MDLTYEKNQCVANPGLAIHGASSPLVKWANTFGVKANGQLSSAITTADAPSLALATLNAPFPNGVAPVVGPLAFDNGTVDPATLSCQVFALVCTVSTVEGVAPIFSWLASEPFSKHGNYSTGKFREATGLSATVGWLTIKNESAAVFIPGTTNLDASGITATYSNNISTTGK